MSIERRIHALEGGQPIRRWITVRPVDGTPGPPYEAQEEGERLQKFATGEELTRWRVQLPETVGVIRIVRQ